MEEQRKQDEKFHDFLEQFFKLSAAVDRLTEHEKLDRIKYEDWHKDIISRLIELEKMRLETTNGRLRDLENRPVIVQISESKIKELFDERAEVHAGRTFFRLVLWVAGALGLVVTSALLAYFKLK